MKEKLKEFCTVIGLMKCYYYVVEDSRTQCSYMRRRWFWESTFSMFERMVEEHKDFTIKDFRRVK